MTFTMRLKHSTYISKSLLGGSLIILMHMQYLMRHIFKAIEAVALKYGLLYIPSIADTKEKCSIGSTDLYFWMESMNDDYDPNKTFQEMCQSKRKSL